MGFIIIMVVATIALAVAEVFLNPISDSFGIAAWITGIIAGIAIIIAIIANVSIKGDIAASQKQYESLVYQLENNLYDNDNDIGKKELYDQVTEWNTDLARGKAMSGNFWLGVFFPKAFYEDFDFIEFGASG